MSLSVVITCHNEERFIHQALLSVTGQTAFDQVGEIVVVDDGSSDGSPEILRRLAAEVDKLTVITTLGVGLPAARNLAIRASSGEFIAFLDGDDYWDPEKLERQLPIIRENSRIGLVYSDFIDFSAADASDAQLITVRRFAASDDDVLVQYFVHDAPVVPSTVIVRRVALDDIGFFNERLRIGEDMEFFMRLAGRWRFQHVAGGLAYKRRHGANITHRLERLLPIWEELNAALPEETPGRARLVAARMARRYARIANNLAERQERRQAFAYLARAAKLDPFYWRIYVYGLLALIPDRLSAGVRRMTKRLFHRLAQLREA